MKIDCYDACKCDVINISVGDTFYFENTLYMRVDGVPKLDNKTSSKVWAVALDKGWVTWFESDCTVTFARCKVVVDS